LRVKKENTKKDARYKESCKVQVGADLVSTQDK